MALPRKAMFEIDFPRILIKALESNLTQSYIRIQVADKTT